MLFIYFGSTFVVGFSPPLKFELIAVVLDERCVVLVMAGEDVPVDVVGVVGLVELVVIVTVVGVVLLGCVVAREISLYG